MLAARADRENQVEKTGRRVLQHGLEYTLNIFLMETNTRVTDLFKQANLIEHL